MRTHVRHAHTHTRTSREEERRTDWALLTKGWQNVRRVNLSARFVTTLWQNVPGWQNVPQHTTLALIYTQNIHLFHFDIYIQPLFIYLAWTYRYHLYLSFWHNIINYHSSLSIWHILSLARVATGIIFVATKHENTCLNTSFVATKVCFRSTHVLDATKKYFVTRNVILSQQKFRRNKNDTCGSSRQ